MAEKQCNLIKNGGGMSGYEVIASATGDGTKTMKQVLNSLYHSISSMDTKKLANTCVDLNGAYWFRFSWKRTDDGAVYGTVYTDGSSVTTETFAIRASDSARIRSITEANGSVTRTDLSNNILGNGAYINIYQSN